MYPMILDEEEYQVIIRHREKIKSQQELLDKQKNCKHVWSKQGWGIMEIFMNALFVVRLIVDKEAV